MCPRLVIATHRRTLFLIPPNAPQRALWVTQVDGITDSLPVQISPPPPGTVGERPVSRSLAFPHMSDPRRHLLYPPFFPPSFLSPLPLFLSLTGRSPPSAFLPVRPPIGIRT